MRTDNPPIVTRLEDYRPTDYAIDEVSLEVRLAPQATRITSRLAVRRRPETPAGTPLVLDGDGLRLKALALDGVPLPDGAYDSGPDRLRIEAPPGDPFALEIVTELDPQANKALMGLYRSNGVYTTQCEAEGFRRITYFLDRPDVLSVYTVRLEANRGEAPVLLANGNRVASGPVEGTDRHYAVWHDPHPKPSYLFAMVAGDLAMVADRFTTGSGCDIDLAIYCEHGKEARCAYAMDALKRSMRWDEETFGREYDLDVFNIVAVSDFNMGAMENKGLNVFNDKFVLADPDTATDADYAHIESVIAHEYFHNWTGNRITCRDWFQLCLKEGLTVYRDQEFSSDMRSRPVKRIADVTLLRQHQFPEDAGPLAHPVRPREYREINNFYTATVYEKGAEIIRMLATVLGATGFRAGMDLYFARHDGRAATIEDFLACFAEAADTDLAQFALWYERAGTPLVDVAESWDTEQGALSLVLSQSRPTAQPDDDGRPLHIPLRFGLVDRDGRDLKPRSSDLAVTGDIIHLTQARQQVVFEDLPERPALSILRGLSAPVRLTGGPDRATLVSLAARDPDPFSRWEALHRLALERLAEASRAVPADGPAAIDDALIEALRTTAEDVTLEPAFRAAVLQTPSVIDIAQMLGRDVDPDAVQSACDGWRRTIGERIGDALVTAAHAGGSPDPLATDPTSAGQRAFHHAARGLAARGQRSHADAVANGLAEARNLTDRIFALRTLVDLDHRAAPAALAAFRDRYHDVPLVLDKWFAIQATKSGWDTLERVEALMRDPAFDSSNPNRVYALLRSFGAANITGFNRPDGRGYDFIAARIIDIDPRNPSVAARLATCFRSWRMHESGRRAQAERVLNELADRGGLSRDVHDIVTRSLGR